MPRLFDFTPRLDARGSSRWPFIVAILLVAAGAIVMFVVTRPPAPKEPEVVEGNRTPGGTLVLAGDSARFVWSGDTRADVYRLEVYDVASRLLAAAVLRDTVVLASAVLPETASAGLWRVVPVSAGGTELPPSDTARFVRR